MSDAYRKVARGQAEFSAMFGTPCHSLTSDWPHSFADVVQLCSSTGPGVQMVAMGEDDRPQFCLRRKNPSPSPGHLKVQSSFM
eukprot:1161363-Pelagomonas_calceolata.AAC.6